MSGDSWRGVWSMLRGVLPAAAACGLLAATAVIADEASATVGSGPVPAHWSTQKMQFTYTGFTALYSCEGIEDKVRTILLAFGANKNPVVTARGCERVNNDHNFSKVAWVDVEFSSLVPGPDPKSKGSVPAAWSKVELLPGRPSFMGLGECELVDELRPVLQKGFSLRTVQYRTDCVPNHVTVADYHVQAEALRLVAH